MYTQRYMYTHRNTQDFQTKQTNGGMDPLNDRHVIGLREDKTEEQRDILHLLFMLIYRYIIMKGLLLH